MPSCLEVTMMIEQGLSGPMSLLRRSQVFIHTHMCGACHAYLQQSHIIHQVLLRMENRPYDVQRQSELPEKIKERIISKL